MSNIPTCTEAVMRRRDRPPAGLSHSGTVPVQLAGQEGQGQGRVQGREDGRLVQARGSHILCLA